MESDLQLRRIRDSVALIGRLSDGILGAGPLKIGIDGVLSWIPVVGGIYSTGAAAFILIQGVRAGVPASTLVGAAALMGGRTIVTAVPVAGPAISDLFRAHGWAARLVVSAIDDQLQVAQPRRRRWFARRNAQRSPAI